MHSYHRVNNKLESIFHKRIYIFVTIFAFSVFNCASDKIDVLKALLDSPRCFVKKCTGRQVTV